MTEAHVMDAIYQQREHYKLFCNRLRMVREQANLTQAQLAEMLGVSRPTITMWETGRVDLTVYQAFMWCTACGASRAWVMGGSDIYAKEISDVSR